MRNKTILVVGGAGYIGSHVNKLLHDNGYKTVVFDNLSRGNRQSVIYGEFVEGDIANADDLHSVFTRYKFDAVMHFAAFTDVGESIVNPRLYYQNNVTNTLNLLDAMLSHHVDNFIFSSSAAIFGFPQQLSISENHPCNPINPYGHTKLMIETILHDYDVAYNLKSCCFRYFNAAGADPEGKIPWQNRKEHNIIPILLKCIQEPKGKFTIYGTDYATKDGTCIRDYIHVLDIAEAHLAGMEKLFDQKQSSAYNLGNANGYTVREVIKAVESVTGISVDVIEGKRREGDPDALIANASKAELELNWKPKYPKLETMIDHAWQLINKKSKEIL